MGSYFELEGRENNSKSISNMMVSVIREFDKKYKKLYYPEYYNENGIGCGDWWFSKRGIAWLCFKTKEQIDNEDWIENYTYSNHIWHDFNGDKEEYYRKWTEDTKKDLNIVYNIFTDTLIMATLFKDKTLWGHWV